MDFSFTTEYISKIHSDVKYTFRRIGPPQRASIEFQLAEKRQKQRELEDVSAEARISLTELIRAAGVDDEGKPKVESDKSLITPEMVKVSLEWQDEQERALNHARAYLYPDYLRAGLSGIEGITMDGKPIKVEQFITLAPDKLYDEAAQAILSGMYLPPSDANFSQPSTTTSEAEQGQKESTSVAPAKPDEITSNETVSSTSLK